ncbi:MAG: hypothetical protein ACR2GY_05525, partial [Phycisphaerales bacterium]
MAMYADNFRHKAPDLVDAVLSATLVASCSVFVVTLWLLHGTQLSAEAIAMGEVMRRSIGRSIRPFLIVLLYVVVGCERRADHVDPPKATLSLIAEGMSVRELTEVLDGLVWPEDLVSHVTAGSPVPSPLHLWTVGVDDRVIMVAVVPVHWLRAYWFVFQDGKLHRIVEPAHTRWIQSERDGMIYEKPIVPSLAEKLQHALSAENLLTRD